MPSPAIDILALRGRLAVRPATRAFRWLPARRAAVAIILDPDHRVLLTRRAARAGDRWSSHVSLPGGMHHPSDRSLADTAARETREEVGVDVGGMELIGRLDELHAIANGGLRPMSIAPFVYVAPEPLNPEAGPEVASIFWLPLDLARSGALDDRVRHRVLRVPLRLPCWRYQGHVIWGLTYGVLKTVLRLGAPRPR